MKKILIVIIAVLGMVVNANAQKVKLGAKAGLNINTLSKSKDFVYENYSSAVSFHVGAVAEITISEKFSFQPELIYSAQGAKVKFNISNEGTFKLNYLNVPLLTKYYVADRFSVEVGPKIGFLLSAEQIVDSNSQDYKDFLKTIDFGLSFGVSYALDDTGLNFGARYNLGFSNILDSPVYGEESGTYSIKNSVLQISVGYLF